MKIGILTFHNAHNYGAVLQAYALKTLIKNMGYDVKIINYRNEALKKAYSPKLKINIAKRDLIFPTRWKNLIKQKMQNKFAQDEWSKQYLAFSKFINSVLLDGDTLEVTQTDLEKETFDYLICGSDQIWNTWITNGLDKVYFLDFKTNAKKISYAASMPCELVNKDKSETKYLKDNISKFDYVSVREEELAKKLSKICKRSIEVTLDPSLLLDSEDYEKIELKTVFNKKYIFVYLVSEDDKVLEIADKIGKKMNLEVIELHYYLQKRLKGHNQIADIGPSEFLTYIKNSEFVLTNSFHGTVFSILYKKNFYSIYSRDSRKDNLLNMLNLNSRHIYSLENINLSDDIDYNKVYLELNKCRKNSIDFLKKSLK